MTAKPQPKQITSQPAPRAFDLSKLTAAHTPLPSSKSSAVPMNSPQKTDVFVMTPLTGMITARHWKLRSAAEILETHRHDFRPRHRDTHAHRYVGDIELPLAARIDHAV